MFLAVQQNGQKKNAILAEGLIWGAEGLRAAKHIALGLTILSGVACLLIYGGPFVIGKLLLAKPNDVGTIGIIGGADGPTAIFVTSESRPCFLALVVFVISLFSWLFLLCKAKKEK